MTFSTLDIHKGTDLDSGSEGDDSEKNNDLDLALPSTTSNGGKNVHNGSATAKQLTSMKMDDDYKPL